MLCHSCQKKEATIHLTQIIEGKIQKLDLCEECAKAQGLTEPLSGSLASLMMGTETKTPEPASEDAGVRCPDCGFTHADLRRINLLGCPTCWETFEKTLMPLLRTMHKGERHVGKIPRRVAYTLELTEKVRALREELNLAVQREKYEDAAQLRDRIRQLESKMRGSLDQP
ncbi:MAG: UvrB/UvrC motif-containing protein [Verrucomicrobiae bacterium]|nr:UvrB/UvrC motif-containing protein [Verrucomicrobiae bacterium]